MATTDTSRRLLGLLGLARRAGKLAVGATAVRVMAARGGPTLLILARDISPGQKEKLLRLVPPEDVLDDLLDRSELAAALGREDLVVVALQDRAFLKGIRSLIAGC